MLNWVLELSQLLLPHGAVQQKEHQKIEFDERLVNLGHAFADRVAESRFKEIFTVNIKPYLVPHTRTQAQPFTHNIPWDNKGGGPDQSARGQYTFNKI